MTLQELLTKKKDRILDRCLDLLFAAYPHESAALLKNRSDSFSNPVGSTFHREIEVLLDGIAAGADTKEMLPALDAIVRIRAVQEFRPSDAVSFIMQFKRAIREELSDACQGSELAGDLSRIESRIDELTLAAFDLYVACREKIAEIRVREARSESDRLARVLRALEQGHGSGTLDGCHGNGTRILIWSVWSIWSIWSIWSHFLRTKKTRRRERRDRPRGT